MAHAFANLGFETAGTGPGLADQWTFVSAVFGDQYAAYDVAVPEAFEDFEEEWGNADTFFELPPGAVAAVYDVAPPQAFEDFETEWNNSPHFWTLPAGVDATYDVVVPQSVEDFEEEWQNNEDDLFVFSGGDTTPASYDFLVPEDREDFEEEWQGNQGDIFEFTGGDTVAAVFDGEAFEDFEEVDLRMHTVEITAVGADSDRYDLTLNGVVVTYIATGVGTVGSIRDLIVTLANAAQTTAVASADGAARIKLRSAVSGDPLQVKISTTGLAGMVLLPPPDKSLNWTQTGELDL